MISKQWRERLTYLAMSVFVAWHTVAMVLGPPPDSPLSRSLRAWWEPYLTFFRLESSWTFFAPEIGKHGQFRYVVEDADGNEHSFIPANELNRFHPKQWWFTFVYD